MVRIGRISLINMKILHVDEQTGWRGGEQQASWLIEELAKRGHGIGIAGRPGSAILAHDHGGVAVEKYSVPMRSEADVPSMRRLGNIVGDNEFDIIHAHSSHAHTFACMAKKFSGRGQAVVSRRTDNMPGSSWLNRWKYSLPDQFVPCSRRVDEVLSDFGVPDNRRTLVYDCIRPDLLEVDPIDRADLGVGEDAEIIFTAGALSGAKDFENLVRAVPFFIDRFPNARVLIAGEGSLRTRIEHAIDELDLNDVVTLLGQRSDVANLLHSADLYASSSSTEGLGTSVLEALACELPVVATDAGGVKEMVLNGRTGYLVPKKDPAALGKAIAASLEDRANAQSMARTGIEHINANFLPEQMVDNMIKVYEKVLTA
jgi:glycosyltransferase involved in cell wall biosynthesis